MKSHFTYILLSTYSITSVSVVELFLSCLVVKVYYGCIRLLTRRQDLCLQIEISLINVSNHNRLQIIPKIQDGTILGIWLTL